MSENDQNNVRRDDLALDDEFDAASWEDFDDDFDDDFEGETEEEINELEGAHEGDFFKPPTDPSGFPGDRDEFQ